MRILVIAVLTLLAAAAPASAAFTLNNPSSKPADVKGGAHSDVTIHVETQGGDIKDLDLHLPPGLVGNPNATPRCPLATFRANGQCPDATQVGEASNDLVLDAVGLPLTASGPIYNVQTEGNEPARLGIRVNSPIPGAAPILLESVASTRPTDQGLDSALRNIPNKADGQDITITALDVVLYGKSGAQKNGKPFARNPTSCAVAETSFDAVSYAGEKATTKTSFTPTNCELLPFDPSFTAAVTGDSGQGEKPTLATNVGQVDGEANTRRVAVTLPTDFGVSLQNLGRACTPEQFSADQCPPAATVGSATAVTPLLTTPLQGPVDFVVGSGNLPDLVLRLKGQLTLTLRGTNAFAPGGGQITTFDGLPDVPLSQFELRFGGGESGLLTATRDLCAGPPPQFGATFTAHSGKEVTKTVAATVAGCTQTTPTVKPKPPTAKLRLRGKSLRLTVRGNGRRVRKVRMTLPKGVAIAKNARGRVSGANAKGTKLRFRSKVVELTVPGAGARSVGLALRSGAVRNAGALRKRAARVVVTTRDGKRTTKRLRA